MVILGRSIAARAEGLEGCMRRIEVYAKTGVDGIFFVGLQTRKELEALRSVTDLPFLLGSATPELQDAGYLASRAFGSGCWARAVSGSGAGGV